MTTAFAIGVLVVAAGVGLAFVWSMFSGAGAWFESDREPPESGDEATQKTRESVG